MSNRGLVVPVDGRRMISTGVGIALVVAGAILRFAVPATFTYGLNAHVVSVIVMLVGVFGLLLSLLVWGPLDRRRKPLRRFRPRGPPACRVLPCRVGQQPGRRVAVLIPEIQHRRWHYRIRQNQRGLLLAAVLRASTDVVICTIPCRPTAR